MTCYVATSCAVAQADTESNTIIGLAEGPLAGGVSYGGTTPGTDVDWYVFYVAGQVELDVTLSTTKTCFDGGGMVFELTTGELNGGLTSTRLENAGDVAHLRYTTPSGTSRIYLRTQDNCNDETDYTFTILPEAAVVPGPNPFLPALPTAEPNERISQAKGPLAGAIAYQGDINSSNDIDWYYFYAHGGRTLDVSVTGLDAPDFPGFNERGGPVVQIIARGAPPATAVFTTFLGHLRFHTLPGMQRYYLRATPGAFAGYLFRIDPAVAISTAPECERTRRLVRTRRATVSRLRRQHASARRLRIARGALRGAQVRVGRLCG